MKYRRSFAIKSYSLSLSSRIEREHRPSNLRTSSSFSFFVFPVFFSVAYNLFFFFLSISLSLSKVLVINKHVYNLFSTSLSLG